MEHASAVAGDRDFVVAEAAKRRTFAIISHPDAGKTTLTEKLLLYGGQLVEAGAVHGKRSRRVVASDWMEIERKHGISVTSTVLRFEHRGVVFNLLDIPGHRDFSEDTLRVLAAADAAVMLLDAARGVEPQTLRLFEVARATSSVFAAGPDSKAVLTAAAICRRVTTGRSCEDSSATSDSPRIDNSTVT